jgi:hypothetical protein
MHGGRPQTLRAGAALWAASALLAAVVAPQPGLAQQVPAAKSDAGPFDLYTPPMLLGKRNGKDDEEPTVKGVWFLGYDYVRGAHYGYSGGIVALNGDLSRNGFVLRLYGSRVDYELSPFGDGRGYQADLMLGYRVSTRRIEGGLYIGADYQDYRLSPDDPTAEVRGTEWGFKVVADLATVREGTPFYFGLEGEYSTSFQTYWARGRAGLNMRGFTLGPEVIALGDLDFDAQRVGGFIITDLKLFPRSPPMELSLHVGHQFIAGSDGGVAGTVGGREGTYAGIELTFVF